MKVNSLSSYRRVIQSHFQQHLSFGLLFPLSGKKRAISLPLDAIPFTQQLLFSFFLTSHSSRNNSVHPRSAPQRKESQGRITKNGFQWQKWPVAWDNNFPLHPTEKYERVSRQCVRICCIKSRQAVRRIVIGWLHILTHVPIWRTEWMLQLPKVFTKLQLMN